MEKRVVEPNGAKPGAKLERVPAADVGEEAGGGGAPDLNPEETNVWPTDAEEASFLAESRGRGEVVVPVPRETAEDVEASKQPLPKLEELVNRIPAETRELLDELFRAKFVAVRRVKQADLKS